MRTLATRGLALWVAWAALGTLGCAQCGGSPEGAAQGGSSSGAATAGGDGGGGASSGDAGQDAGPGCLLACQPGHCGAVPDGCTGFLTCSQCPDGEVCGLNQPNTCGVPASSCVPLTAEVACAGRCGSVSNGCDDVISCEGVTGAAACTPDQVCGGFGDAAQPNTCVDKPACVPATCAQLGAECGEVGDGCGDVLDCTDPEGICAGSLVCGTGADSNRCVAPVATATCTPLTDEQACMGTCGVTGDGCSGQVDCEATAWACPAATVCGGGGVPGECGAATSSCAPVDVVVACAGRCGMASDGCGGLYACTDTNGGWTCNSQLGESCGGGGIPYVCGRPACQPRTVAQACPGAGGSASCGMAPDGCGGLVSCGGCGAGEVCGIAAPSVCGPAPSCQPVAAATACAGRCGQVPNGCGGSYGCGAGNGGVSCSGGQVCGATAPNVCGTLPTTCVPQTCAQLGHSCGLASNGCGAILNCWPAGATQCPDPTSQACVAGSNGVQACANGTSTCTGSLCNQLPTCGVPTATKLTGTVVTPGRMEGATLINQIPVPNAVVYIPGTPGVALPAIFQGVQVGNAASCGRCEDEVLVAPGQTVLAAAVTDYRGRFSLEGRLPVGVPFNLVIKAGKWRRVVQIPAGVVQACQSAALTVEQTRLARNPLDGLAGTWLPKVAVSTGSVDAMECLFRNVGVDESEFTVPSEAGRIHMYRANGQRMCTGTYTQGANTLACRDNNNFGCTNNRAGCSTASVPATDLYQSQAALSAYDMVVIDCEGAEVLYDGSLAAMDSYANAGGRLFASHFAYVWLERSPTMAPSASWLASGSNDSGTGFISLPAGATQRPRANAVKSLVFRDWLDWQGALTGTVAGQLDSPTTPQFTIAYPRDRAGATAGPATDEWVYRTNSGTKIQQLSFNTPYAAAQGAICGRVAYSGFHVSNTSSSSNVTFPGSCSNTPLTPQERILVFMLFDLAACVSTGDPITPPQCAPRTTADVCPGANDACGAMNDGCGGVVDCGLCGDGYYCDGNTCRLEACTPATCATLGYNCGSAPDGCGGIARNSVNQEGCGTCDSEQVCGLGGPGRCGSPTCVPPTMAQVCPAGTCGLVSNGCGDVIDCGGCASPLVCGGGGANLCGSGQCSPLGVTTACAGLNCGQVSDGCGGAVNCGMCAAGDSCGGGGQPNVCGHPSCVPLAPAQACGGLQCGWASDGCGGAVACGDCANGGVCGGAGPNLCGGGCAPATCTSAGAECGAISNRCGGIVQCGTCAPGTTCGASMPNRCGSGPACTPRACQQAGAQCGLVGDGCGGVLNCGACQGSLTCGGAGVANQCGVGTGGCTPATCTAMGVACGAASDGCGGLLDCGGCGPSSECVLGVCQDFGG